MLELLTMADDFITIYYCTDLYVKNEKSYILSKMFSDLINEKDQNKNTGSFLSCPAVGPHFKKTIVANSAKYSEHMIEGDRIRPLGHDPYHVKNVRPRTLGMGATFEYQSLSIFFADSPLETLFTSPYFHKAGYTQYASLVPGKFDIGRWFRPFNFEVQSWIEEGKIIIKKGEPLFYINFLTDKKIVMKEFKYNHKFADFAESLIKTSSFLKGEGLEGRYEIFSKSDIRTKIMEEIKNNLLDTPDIIL